MAMADLSGSTARFIESLDHCADCGHCRWCHDGGTSKRDGSGACLGFNAADDGKNGGRQGCIFKCEVFRPRDHATATDPMKFELSGEEVDAARRFIAKHPCKYRGKYTGAIGGVTTYTFTHTSVGLMKSVDCACGASEFLSDDI